jgi:hypothetical protein
MTTVLDGAQDGMGALRKRINRCIDVFRFTHPCGLRELG